MSLGANAEGRLGPLETAPPSLNTTQPLASGATQRTWAEWAAVFPVAAYHHNKCEAVSSCCTRCRCGTWPMQLSYLTLTLTLIRP